MISFYSRFPDILKEYYFVSIKYHALVHNLHAMQIGSHFEKKTIFFSYLDKKK